MDVTATLDRCEALFEEDRANEAFDLLRGLIADAGRGPERARAALLEALCARAAHRSSRIGATFAIVAGALVESGAPVRPLALAIVEPLGRALRAAVRFAALAEAAPKAEEPSDEAIFFFGDAIEPKDAVAIAADDLEALDGYLSLQTWYPPAAAAWSREPSVLCKVQQDAAWRAPLEALGSACEGSRWLRLLLGSVLDAPFAFVFPELDEVWSARVDGVTDVGQLSVLLAAAMHDPLARIATTERPQRAVLDVMTGDGPQQLADASYSASFHLWPWRAMNPASGLPERGRFQWSAPGGTGKHSLPPDFQPGDIEPLRGARVLLVTGPRASTGFGFTRVIGASRLFSGLRARVGDVQRLSGEEGRAFVDAARMAISS